MVPPGMQGSQLIQQRSASAAGLPCMARIPTPRHLACPATPCYPCKVVGVGAHGPEQRLASQDPASKSSAQQWMPPCLCGLSASVKRRQVQAQSVGCCGGSAHCAGVGWGANRARNGCAGLAAWPTVGAQDAVSSEGAPRTPAAATKARAGAAGARADTSALSRAGRLSRKAHLHLQALAQQDLYRQQALLAQARHDVLKHRSEVEERQAKADDGSKLMR
jgi:hypothetical protein